MSKMVDLTGQKFGRLTAIKPVRKPNDGKLYWECLCDCGNTKVILGSNLKSGATKSCGCLRSKEYVPIELIVKSLKRHLMEDEQLFIHHPELAFILLGV